MVARAIRGLLAGLAVFGVTAPAAQASLSVPGGVPLATYRDTGTPGAANALAAFETALGGQDNGTTLGEQGNGFRHLNWDGLAVDGSDPTSRTISSEHVVGLGAGRLEPWGIEQGPDVAVADDGFTSANGSVAFTPFSARNVWAPYNSNTTEFEVVAPAAPGSVPVPAETRGLGVMFLNVTTTGGTTIQYYNGDILLGQASAQVAAGAPSFVGMLFPSAVITRVVITLGTGEIFAFDGSKPTAESATDFVAGDDVALAEPAPARGAVAATAGLPVTAPLDAFTESDSNATISAVIDWGDGTRTSGTIAQGPDGTLVVTGDHAYAQAGSYTALVTVADFGGPDQTKQTDVSVGPRASTTSVLCSPSPVAVTASTVCTATVSDAGAGGPVTPTGTVAFTSPTAGASFADDSGCVLGATAMPGVAICEVQFTPSQLPPAQARIDAFYGGDDAHSGSAAGAIIGVRAQRCTLQALSAKLTGHPAVLGVLVTCDARANVTIAAKAIGTRNGRFKAFTLAFGTVKSTVTAGRPTVLVIRPSQAVLDALRTAARGQQRVSLRLTLTASSHATRSTTTTRVASFRLLR
jgi:hypothetical protein